MVSTGSRLPSISFSALWRYYLRQEPYEGVPHVRIAGGARVTDIPTATQFNFFVTGNTFLREDCLIDNLSNSINLYDAPSNNSLLIRELKDDKSHHNLLFHS